MAGRLLSIVFGGAVAAGSAGGGEERAGLAGVSLCGGRAYLGERRPATGGIST